MKTQYLLGIPFIFLAGCYTQFATLERPSTPAPGTEIQVDSTGDTIKVIRKIDTVEVKDRQVCYWQRDFFGRPVLRCYTTYYDDDWYFYRDYPWWYDRYSSYSHYDCHCPYHITYHAQCRYCWDYCYRNCHECYTSRYDDHDRYYPSYPSRGTTSSPSSATSSRGGGGIPVKPSSRGDKPLIAGPRPQPLQTPKGMPKETPQTIEEPPRSAPADTSRAVKPVQPNRRYRRSR